MQLSGLDIAFFCLEGSVRPMHMGALLVFDPPVPVHPARITKLLASRSAAIPQLTRSPQLTWWPPGGAAWAHDSAFTADQHIQAYRLPRPGTWEQLAPVVAALMAEPLPVQRPPWELHVITELAGAQFAVLAKLHHALADGAGVPAIAGALLDDLPNTSAPQQPQVPTDSMAATTSLPGRVRTWSTRALRTTGDVMLELPTELTSRIQRTGRAVGIASATLAATRPFSIASPVTSMFGCSGRRQWAQVRLDADELHRARKQHGGTLNDVVLSVVAGGLRTWLRHKGDAATLDAGWTLRAFIPVSMRARRAPGKGGNHLSGYLCDLPVGEPDPVARLRRVCTAMEHNKATGPACGAGAFPLLAEELSALAHRLTTPVLGRAAPLLFDTMVTTVPVPDVPLRLGGAALHQIHPIAPLAHGHALSIAIATYRGSVQIGLLTDADLLPGVAQLGDAIVHAADALQHACDPHRVPPHRAT